MRVGQINKNAEAVRGRQIKRAPFNRSGYEWHPAESEVYGFMTSGMARFDLDNNNVRERSNVTLYRRGVGPTNNVNFQEVARRADGFPVGTGGETAAPTPTSTPDEPETCVEPPVPETENNTHIYNGSADGEIVVSGAVDGRQAYDEAIGITVKDDRSISIALDGDEAFLTSTVAADGSYSGGYTRTVLPGCNVDITTAGVINEDETTGTATANETCAGATAILDATFIATSITQPSFLDQQARAPRPARGCPLNIILAPIINFLLEDN
ncbi:MAG: hypothetical protein ACJAQ6_002006 [Arenicella sp.]|jgi:hypothetical protein